MMLTKLVHKMVIYLLPLMLSAKLFAEEIHIGILDWRTLEDFDQHWLPSLQAIQKEMPAHRLVLHAMTLEELNLAVDQNALDFVITNPGHYVALSATHAVAPLAQLQHVKSGLPLNFVGSVLLTHRDNAKIHDFTQLNNVTIAAVSSDSFGGYQIMLDTLYQNHSDFNRWNIDWQFMGFPMDQLVDRLLNHEVDAIVLRSCLAEVMALEGHLDLTQLRVIGKHAIEGYPCMLSTPLYPGWPLLRTDKVNDTLARQVLAALMKSESLLVGQEVVHWQPPVSYQQVYEVFERLRIGPYAAFPHNPILHWLNAHKHWFMGAFILLVFLIFHNIRAEYLVRKRSSELELSQKQRQEAEETARQQQDELRHASRFVLMGELAASLAHELNQPLTTIANYAHGSIRHLNKENEELLNKREQLIDASKQIAFQADHAAAVIKNIRSFLKKEAGEYSWVCIEALMKDTLLFCKTRLDQAQIEPKLLIQTPIPKIYSHPVYLLQILANLITNALDAMTETQEMEKECCISVYPLNEQNRLIFQVADRGKGIDPSIEQQLFEPFVTSRKEGMGLGLSLSRSLAESLDGYLQLTHRQGGGAVAELGLPLLVESKEMK